MNLNLIEELENEFCTKVLGCNLIVNRLDQLLPNIKPLTFSTKEYENIYTSPAILQKLVTGLHKYLPSLVSKNIFLFSMYIPCIFPAKELYIEKEIYINERNRLLTIGIPSGQSNRKRKYCQIH